MADKERYLLMQAFLEWEKKTTNKLKLKMNKKQEHISFTEILQESDIPPPVHEEINTARDACMRNNI